ncbi:MAG: sulfatase [Vicinamibacteria bacterium]
MLSAGCPGKPGTVVYDLAERLPVADRWSTREVVLFGTPSAEPYLREGFYTEAGGAAADRFLWSKGEAELALTFAAAASRAAVLDVRPYDGVRGQRVEVRLNDVPVESFALNDHRHRYLVRLPAAAQKAGENRLRFVFSGTATPGNADKRNLAAAFHSLTVGAADDATLSDLLGRGAPAPAAVALDGGVPEIEQVGPSVLRFALRLPPGARLRFTPALHRQAIAADGAAALRVTVEGETGGEHELWSQVLRARDAAAGEVTVALPGRAGDVVRLALATGGDRYAWSVWKAPRVLGDASAPAQRAYAPGDAAKGAAVAKQAAGMNVVLLVLDAARAQQFGCYGYGRPTTPEIDRIAADGVVFERAFTPAVYTLGAMSSVWTSQYPDRHHATVSYADPLPRDRLTLAEILGARGVPTAGFVANAVAGPVHGFDRGFGEFHEVYRMFEDLGSRGAAFDRVLPPWLQKHQAGRFFLYAHFREPHFPYDPGPPFDTQFGADAPLTVLQRRDKSWYTDVNQGRVTPTAEEIAHLVRLYDGNLAYVDQEVGRLRRALEAQGLWDRTVLIVTADHGEQLHEKGYVSHSAQVYEQSTHVPLIVRVPGGPRGLRVGHLVDHLDLAPTILDLFGAPETPFAKQAQGSTLLPMLAGAGARTGDVAGEGVLSLSRTVWDRPVYALRDVGHKLVYDTRTGREELYDLSADPGETNDLSAARAVRGAYYRQTLQQALAGLRQSAPGAAAASPAARIDKETCENLRALGYVNPRCTELGF